MKLEINKFKLIIKKVIFITTNLLLLLDFSLFAHYRYLKIIKINNFLEEELSVVNIMAKLSHELIVLLLGVMSLFGILFFKGYKTFFFFSASFISILAVLVFSNFSLNFLFLTRFVVVLAFVWCLIFENIYTVYNNNLVIRIGIFTSFIVIYSVYVLLK